MSEQTKMKPVIILPVGEMKRRDINLLVRNGICVVECKNPQHVRFVDPPPLGYSAQEQAAIRLCRVLLNPATNTGYLYRKDIAAMLADAFITGTPLDSRAVPAPPAPKR